MISVAAVDSSKNVASFSQRNNQVELTAPGVGVLSTVSFAASSISVEGSTYLGENIDGSARSNALGALLNGGSCSSVGSWGGGVVLCQRGGDTGATRVSDVKNGGAKAAVIYNNVSGGFARTLNGTGTIPAISISLEDGQALLESQLGPSATVTNSGGLGSGYAYYDGTSMATPLVSGVAAPVWSTASDRSNAEVRAVLQATAEDLGPAGKDNAYGYGLVQAKAALDYLESASPPGNDPPTASFTYSCSGPTCSFTDTSTDTDGLAPGTGTSATAMARRNAIRSIHIPAAEPIRLPPPATDNGAATNTSSRVVKAEVASSDRYSVVWAMLLSVTARRIKGRKTGGDLGRSRATGSSADIHRDDVKVANTANDHANTHSTDKRGGATYTDNVCEAGAPACFGSVQFVF